MKKPILWALLAGLAFLGIGRKTLAQTATPTPDCCQGVTFLGGFNSPEGIAIQNGLGLVYLTDPGTRQVKVYHLSGNPVTAFGSAVFGNPMDISVDSAGNIFVADLGQGYVFIFDPNYALVTSFTNSYLGAPRGIYADDSGVTESVYVAGTNSAILRYDRNGNTYSAGLTFATIIGIPDELVKSGNYLYVTNTTGDQVVQYDASNGVSVNAYPVTSAYGLRKDPGGHFIVTDSNGWVTSYSDWASSPVSLCSFPNFPWSAAVGPTGQIFVSEYTGLGVTVFQSCLAEPSPTPSYPGANPPGSGECFIYPSPSRGSQATVSYSMARSGQVDLRVWNEKGELVTHVTDSKPAGVQGTLLSIAGFGSGIYFYSLTLTYGPGEVEKLGPKKWAIIH